MYADYIWTQSVSVHMAIMHRIFLGITTLVLEDIK